jgi:hypothetical protein
MIIFFIFMFVFMNSFDRDGIKAATVVLIGEGGAGDCNEQGQDGTNQKKLPTKHVVTS